MSGGRRRRGRRRATVWPRASWTRRRREPKTSSSQNGTPADTPPRRSGRLWLAAREGLEPAGAAGGTVRCALCVCACACACACDNSGPRRPTRDEPHCTRTTRGAVSVPAARSQTLTKQITRSATRAGGAPPRAIVTSRIGASRQLYVGCGCLFVQPPSSASSLHRAASATAVGDVYRLHTLGQLAWEASIPMGKACSGACS